MRWIEEKGRKKKRFNFVRRTTTKYPTTLPDVPALTTHISLLSSSKTKLNQLGRYRYSARRVYTKEEYKVLLLPLVRTLKAPHPCLQSVGDSNEKGMELGKRGRVEDVRFETLFRH